MSKDVNINGDLPQARWNKDDQIICAKCGTEQQMWLGYGFVEGLTFICKECHTLNELNAH